jgi:neutral/alkaline ceramidase-like enzyme
MNNTSSNRIPHLLGLTVSLSFLVSTLIGFDAHIYADTLQAGVAKINITPEKPVTLAGYGARKGLSQGVHDPLSARVVVWKNQEHRLVLVSTDLIGFYSGSAEILRQAILKECKLKPSELFLSAIHTHSGPNLCIDKDKGHKHNYEYTQILKNKLVQVIRQASENLNPIQIGAGIGYSPVGMNRRQTRNDGFDRDSVGYIRLGRNPYGPADKEVLVLKLAKPDGTTKAVLFDYATHATSLGGKNYIISGDVLGLAEQFVEKILGNDIIVPAFAGASGDIDPWFRVLPKFNDEPGWIPEPVLLGTLLGEEVVHVYRDIKEVAPGGEIHSAFVALELPGKPKSEMSIPKNFPKTSLPITVAKVGNVAFVGLGAEVLTEIGMAIKKASPFEHTFIITHCNGAAGYLPPAKYYKEGGYEIRSSPFAPQAADLVIKQVLKMLHQL